MKSKLVKRGLAFLLAMAMICTSNAFSPDLMLVKAAEADEIAEGMEGYADETESPAGVDDENDAQGSKEDVNTGTDSGSDKEGGANTENGNTDTDNGNSDADSGNTDTGNGNSDADSGNTDTGKGNSDAENGNTDTDDGNADTESGDPDADGENAVANDGNPVDDEEADEGETDEWEADERLEVLAPSYNNGDAQNYYSGFAFKSEEELIEARNDMESLWNDASIKWENAATIEELMEALGNDVEYAYIDQTVPGFVSNTITMM